MYQPYAFRHTPGMGVIAFLTITLAISCQLATLTGCGGGAEQPRSLNIDVDQLATAESIADAWYQAVVAQDWELQQKLLDENMRKERTERYTEKHKRNEMLAAQSAAYRDRVLIGKSVGQSQAVFEVVKKGEEKTARKDVLRIKKVNDKWRVVGVAMHVQ